MGLSATGKSTLTSHGCWLEEPEDASMLQDDVCGLLSDGSVAGSEGEGLYIKTIGLGEDEQPELYEAATAESAILENVAVDDDGTIHFDEDRHTSNSRAVVQREELESADDEIDLSRMDQLFFITRNPLMPRWPNSTRNRPPSRSCSASRSKPARAIRRAPASQSASSEPTPSLSARKAKRGTSSTS